MSATRTAIVVFYFDQDDICGSILFFNDDLYFLDGVVAHVIYGLRLTIFDFFLGVLRDKIAFGHG